MGDSAIFGLKESKVSGRWTIEKQSFPGEKIKDMLLDSTVTKKELRQIVIHVGKNNVPDIKVDKILPDIIEL